MNIYRLPNQIDFKQLVIKPIDGEIFKIEYLFEDRIIEIPRAMVKFDIEPVDVNEIKTYTHSKTPPEKNPQKIELRKIGEGFNN